MESAVLPRQYCSDSSYVEADLKIGPYLASWCKRYASPRNFYFPAVSELAVGPGAQSSVIAAVSMDDLSGGHPRHWVWTTWIGYAARRADHRSATRGSRGA